MVLAIAATLGATGLVLFLQHRAISTLRSQTEVILRQISEQTASDIAVELRRTLDGPVFDTLTAVNHPDLRAGRLDLVAEEYKKGLDSYPHVDRFFAWSAETDAKAPGEAMFYGRGGRFVRDPEMGRTVMALARKYAPTQHIYAAVDGVGPDKRCQVFLRLFWTDAERREYFAVLGFVVDPSRVREQLFAGPTRERLQAVLARREGDVDLHLRVNDEAGAPVYGALPPGVVGSRLPFDLSFYPAEEIRSRLAASVDARRWTIEVGAPVLGGAFAGAGGGYGPTILSVVLMLVALGLTVQANRRSADLAQMQSDFVSHVSHQLKTPLSLLTAATETLQMDRVRSPEKFAAYLDTIRAEAARLSSLVQRVLEFSRLQQQRSYEFEPVDLAALATETVAAFAHGLPGRHFAVTVDPPDAPLPVRADPAALEQVLANLLDNAVKYSAADTPVAIHVRSDEGRAIVEVMDRGVGIAPADQKRVFERFYRAASASHRHGFGLGLTIVREIVKAHGGQVDVSSAPGTGSTFRVTLPRFATERLQPNRQPIKWPEAVS